jgi:undecaprenyl-diphosphatase
MIQGVTEFFPVSSSAHLRLAKWAMNIVDGEHLLHFDLICHTGTLFALILYLRKEVLSALQSLRTISFFTLALLPLIPAYFFLKPIRLALSDPAYLGYFLLFTALLLFLSAKREVKREEGERPLKARDVLCIGVVQTMALLPGISRSGSTIATARLLGWDWIDAARFSFLLAIPAILGGQVLEIWKSLKEPAEAASASLGCCAAGCGASFAMGLLGVHCMFWMYENEIVRPFAWYCLSAGMFALWAL